MEINKKKNIVSYNRIGFRHKPRRVWKITEGCKGETDHVHFGGNLDLKLILILDRVYMFPFLQTTQKQIMSILAEI